MVELVEIEEGGWHYDRLEVAAAVLQATDQQVADVGAHLGVSRRHRRTVRVEEPPLHLGAIGQTSAKGSSHAG